MPAIPDGEYTAVVDRFEGDRAALEVELPESHRELAVDRTELPEDARRPDVVLTIVVRNGELVDAAVEHEETRERAESAQDRFDRLSSRPPKEDRG